MSWNYRVIKKKADSGEYEYGIYEVFYDSEGNVNGSTKDSLVPVCESEDGLKFELNLMMEGLKKATLDYSNTFNRNF